MHACGAGAAAVQGTQTTTTPRSVRETASLRFCAHGDLLTHAHEGTCPYTTFHRSCHAQSRPMLEHRTRHLKYEGPAGPSPARPTRMTERPGIGSGAWHERSGITCLGQVYTVAWWLLRVSSQSCHIARTTPTRMVCACCIRLKPRSRSKLVRKIALIILPQCHPLPPQI